MCPSLDGEMNQKNQVDMFNWPIQLISLNSPRNTPSTTNVWVLTLTRKLESIFQSGILNVLKSLEICDISKKKFFLLFSVINLKYTILLKNTGEVGYLPVTWCGNPECYKCSSLSKATGNRTLNSHFCWLHMIVWPVFLLENVNFGL